MANFTGHHKAEHRIFNSPRDIIINFASSFLGTSRFNVNNYTHIKMQAFITILLLIISNVFMTFAWYGHLKMQSFSWFSHLGLPAVILFSWGIALFEYCFQVPANRFGYLLNGGPFNLWQLKVLQEAITLIVFTTFTLLVFKNETFRLNHVIGFIFLILAVYFIFKN